MLYYLQMDLAVGEGTSEQEMVLVQWWSQLLNDSVSS